jgi:hypothetical protein
MPEWSEDFSQRTLIEVIALQEENRAWQKDLRSKAAALVDSRLSKQIGPEEYAAKRKLVKDDAGESKRRANILGHEVWSRRGDRRSSLVPAP